MSEKKIDRYTVLMLLLTVGIKHGTLYPTFLRGCTVEKKRILDIYKLRELISKATGIVHHVDHMWPLAKGGPEWSGNLCRL
jgi:hypothetical protein